MQQVDSKNVITAPHHTSHNNTAGDPGIAPRSGHGQYLKYFSGIHVRQRKNVQGSQGRKCPWDTPS